MGLKIDLVFIIMLVGHVLGDFYFQTNKMVKNRKKHFSAVVKHSLIYFSVITAILICGIPMSPQRITLCATTSMAHFLIDSLKFVYQTHEASFPEWFKKNLFILDQLTHIISLVVCWLIWGKSLGVRWFISQEMTHLPDLPITIFLGFLLIMRPVSIFIAENLLPNYKSPKSVTLTDNDVLQNAGRIIGYLERIIVFILLLYQQFSTIAFVLTAKSVARYKDIENNRASAEYYLIGTLMSVSCTLVISFLLGLCNS